MSQISLFVALKIDTGFTSIQSITSYTCNQTNVVPDNGI
jgi:hypothetical protein